jgi:hypothetical protein
LIEQKITLLILNLFFGLYAMGQQNPSSEVVSATMPIGTKHLTKAKVLDYVHKNYKRSQISVDRKNIYQLDGLLISFWDLSINPEFKKSLQDSQSEMLGLLKRNPENVINYYKIITVNNIQFLIYEYQKQDEVFLRFQSEYDKNNKDICGLIQFKTPDEAKAQKALNDLLQTVHFKE